MGTIMEFFKKTELERFAMMAGKPYDAGNEEHQQYVQEIIHPLLEKTEHWAQLVEERMQANDFIVRFEKKWLQLHRQGNAFKPYTWARIFRRTNSDKGIFFTVGIEDKRGLIVKLDYQYDGTTPLSEVQKQKCKLLIKEEAWKKVEADDVTDYNWDRLLEETVKYFKEGLDYYDWVIETVYKEEQGDQNLTMPLCLTLPPMPHGSDYKNDKYIKEVLHNEETSSISEQKAIDYIEKAIRDKEVGSAGEQLVIDYEKQQLRNLGRFDLENEVQKVPDKYGYDILSFDKDGKEKHIEVKTTTGGLKTSFFMTKNEIQIAINNPDSYYLYRLFEYRPNELPCPFFIVRDIEAFGNFEPVIFRVVAK